MNYTELTKAIIDTIISTDGINIDWIPDSLERSLYQTLFEVIAPLLQDAFNIATTE